MWKISLISRIDGDALVLVPFVVLICKVIKLISDDHFHRVTLYFQLEIAYNSNIKINLGEYFYPVD